MRPQNQQFRRTRLLQFSGFYLLSLLLCGFLMYSFIDFRYAQQSNDSQEAGVDQTDSLFYLLDTLTNISRSLIPMDSIAALQPELAAAPLAVMEAEQTHFQRVLYNTPYPDHLTSEVEAVQNAFQFMFENRLRMQRLYSGEKSVSDTATNPDPTDPVVLTSRITKLEDERQDLKSENLLLQQKLVNANLAYDRLRALSSNDATDIESRLVSCQTDLANHKAKVQNRSARILSELDEIKGSSIPELRSKRFSFNNREKERIVEELLSKIIIIERGILELDD